MRNLPHPHTWEDKQLQSNKHPVHTRPWAGAYWADCRNEWSLCGMSDLWVGCEADTLLYLPVRPSEACLLSAASVRLYLLRGILGISATQGLLLPFLSTLLTHTHIKTHTQLTLCLYKDMGAGHPSLTEKKDNKDEIQVRSHPKTCRQGLACERRPLQRWGYFWSCEGFTQSIYITGMPLMSALKRVLLLKKDTLILNRWAKPSSSQF